MHVSPSRQKPSPSGKVSALPTEEDIAFPPLEQVSALPTEEDIAFPFGEGVGFADRRGLYGGKCPPSAELNESKNKKVRALCRIWHKWKRLHVGEMSPANGNCYYRNKRRQRGANERLK